MASSARRCSAVGSGKGKKDRIPEVDMEYENTLTFALSIRMIFKKYIPVVDPSNRGNIKTGQHLIYALRNQAKSTTYLFDFTVTYSKFLGNGTPV